MDGRYWSSVGITGLNAAFDGALAYGSAQLTNIPHGRLAYGALLGLNLLTDTSLGIGSGGVAGNVANGLAASLTASAATILTIDVILPLAGVALTPLAAAGVAAGITFGTAVLVDYLLTQNGIDVGQAVSQFMSEVSSVAIQMATDATATFNSALDFAQQMVDSTIQNIQNAASSFSNALLDGIDALSEAFNNAWDAAGSLLEQIGDLVNNPPATPPSFDPTGLLDAFGPGGLFGPDGPFGDGEPAGGDLGDLFAPFSENHPNPLGLFDPLIFDLDGDGLDLTPVADSDAYFDYAGTGFAFHTGWVEASEGILIREIDQNPNTVTAEELLGAISGNAFQDLTGLDGNHDGVINASDAIFAQLRIWQDLDGDAIADSGELISLAAAGIAAINLSPQQSGQFIAGNTVVETSTFVRTDGTTGTVAEVNFATDTLYSRYTPPANFQVSPSALFLPSLVGYGLVPDLVYAMSLRPELEDTVRDLVLEANEMSGSEFATAFESLVQNWAGVDDVNPTSAGPLIDARHLALVEAFYGATFAQMNGATAT
jgi:hypothetical protein